jgi:hypothetical protein
MLNYQRVPQLNTFKSRSDWTCSDSPSWWPACAGPLSCSCASGQWGQRPGCVFLIKWWRVSWYYLHGRRESIHGRMLSLVMIHDYKILVCMMDIIWYISYDHYLSDIIWYDVYIILYNYNNYKHICYPCFLVAQCQEVRRKNPLPELLVPNLL